MEYPSLIAAWTQNSEQEYHSEQPCKSLDHLTVQERYMDKLSFVQTHEICTSPKIVNNEHIHRRPMINHLKRRGLMKI